MSQPEFIELRTEDGLILPGLLYRAGKPGAVAVYLHGNGSSSVFYNEAKNRVLAAALSRKGIATLFLTIAGRIT
jgi:hypothetical protein